MRLLAESALVHLFYPFIEKTFPLKSSFAKDYA